MRPFFPYYGSKWNIARHYPVPTGHVIEPFAGSASYATYYDAPRASLIDADPVIVGVWRYLLAARPAEILSLPELPNVGDSVDDLNITQEARWLIGFWLNRGSAAPKKSRTAYSARTDRAQLTWGLKAKERIAAQLPLINGWSIVEGDFEAAPADAAGTYFVDPPYGDKGKHYRVQFAEFARLGRWCESAVGKVIVCEGPSATWLPFERLGSFKTSRGRAEEFVWCNVPPTQRDLLIQPEMTK